MQGTPNMSHPTIDMAEHPQAAAAALAGRTCIGVEFMYKPRPVNNPASSAFTIPLAARCAELARQPRAALLLLCANPATLEPLRPLLARSPFPVLAAYVNPQPLSLAHAPDPDTPARCGWDEPARWQPITTTDRWARLSFALETGALLAESGQAGALALAAHDAVWGRGLLALLQRTSTALGVNGVPAAVSPYTPYQHSHLPGAPAWAIAAINAAFNRDPGLPEGLRSGRYQGFWGKTALLPFALCRPVLRQADQRVWEDDLEIDRALRAAGHITRALWIVSPRLYRQALPVFDEAGIAAVIDRTLHYSMNVPARPLGANSRLLHPLSARLRWRRRLNPAYDRALKLAEHLADASLAAAADRLARTGVSWVDWGAYRHVVQPGKPFVTVWLKGDAS